MKKSEVTTLAEKMDSQFTSFAIGGYQVQIGSYAADHDEPSVRISTGSADVDDDHLGIAWISPRIARRIAGELDRMADDVEAMHRAWLKAEDDE